MRSSYHTRTMIISTWDQCEAIRRRNPSAIWHAPRGAARVLERAGVRAVARRRAGDVSDVGNVAVRTVTAAHGGDRSGPRKDEHGAEAVGFVVQAPGGPSIWFAGDTELDPSLAQIGPVDVALVPVGGWWRGLGPGHMNGVEAARAVRLVDARIAIPIHWGTYHPSLLYWAMASVWNQPADTFHSALGRIAPEVDARLLAVGMGTVVHRNDGG